MRKRLTRVLLVDDDKSFLEETGRYLKESCEDMQLDTAISVRRALQRFTKQDYDVVVSGYKMEEMNGIQFLRELRKRGLQTPFILFTSEGGEEIAVEAFRSGVDDYVVRKGDKKSRYDELVGSIRQAIGRRKEEEERCRTIAEALRETEKRLLAVIENLGAGLGIADKEGIYTYVNPERARLLGYTPEEMIGKPQRSFVHEDSLRIRDVEIEKRRRGESSSYEVNLVSKDGKVVPVLAIGTPILDEQGQYAGSYGLTIDLAERKKIEQALLLSEERYRTLVELAHDGIMMTEGPERTINFANSKMEEMMGYTVEELSGRSYLDLVHPDEKEEALQNIETDIASRKGGMYARRLVRKDGSTIDALISISLVDPSSETTIPRAILIITDITESIKAKEALAKVSGRIQDLEKEVAGLKEAYPSSAEQELGKRIEISDLLQLPDHLRETLIGLSEMSEATAGEVAEKTGRVRNIESVYLNQLERMGLVEKYRKGRRIYFRARSVGGRSVRRVLRQLYGEGR